MQLVVCKTTVNPEPKSHTPEVLNPEAERQFQNDHKAQTLNLRTASCFASNSFSRCAAKASEAWKHLGNCVCVCVCFFCDFGWRRLLE